ncbi:hypothetical protein BD289DRAFT_54671 [Coniella lustricola]|uniref:Uncharacterized protein n=1 Tax=Coniella lustricola TaxID=2025994 RepID=A0A2T3A0W9_9PEZI|nr:hypothetical protein BD289DRAFT_54671 [Coniella lustricola]
MPPKKAVAQDPSDMPICIHMRYGIHTFSLLVEPLAPFSDITSELLFAIRDRDPDNRGLCADVKSPPQALPADGSDIHVAYGVLRDPNDSEKGWTDLKIQGHEIPVEMGIKNNALVAFVIRSAEDAAESPEFVAQWPQFEPEEDEQDDYEAGDVAAGKRRADVMDMDQDGGDDDDEDEDDL